MSNADIERPKRPILDVITPRRLVTLAVILFAVVVSVVGLQKTDTTPAPNNCGTSAGPILKLLPCPGDNDVSPLDIGADLSPGYMMDLYIDGSPIPNDQLTVEGGLMYFRPGSGLAISTLSPGRHTAKIVYYKDLADEANGAVYSWNFMSH